MLLFFFFWPHCMACGILVPSPGIEPTSPALEVWSLNHWTTREVPYSHCLWKRNHILRNNSFSGDISDGKCILLAGVRVQQILNVKSRVIDEGIGAIYPEEDLWGPSLWGLLDVRVFHFSLNEGKSSVRFRPGESFWELLESQYFVSFILWPHR